MNVTLERASHAVEDALASDDNHPDDIARAVLASLLNPSSLEPHVVAGAKTLQAFEEEPIPYAAGAVFVFQDMIRAILNDCPA